eukprot:CAMPEP_0113302134 /NCGR_PEP_ID=MMETSP0010_2-20120614/3071_1 /TAXON_ID=216773 ORGANISM="Corethron hystrix, Strain 308" /NCGR_SAMPLE_ID=MMETSP0010_2 /ASSEMBLY_ACC=CAM_ASM_000155 /LENGTH=139 /DNA_ID=CAMNT_0000155869 /DNA_START=96 /DNA_END=515 /DNA_ORIENTATION=+ /assembly_acc=CAM_ASM_000155
MELIEKGTASRLTSIFWNISSRRVTNSGSFSTKNTNNQGHSVSIDLELEPMIPPEELFHGTVDRFLDDIRSGGLNKMSRQYVHLSQDLETAAKVGQRRGKPVILKIRSGDMCPEAYTFYKSNNGIWLTNHVPAAYIKFP